eukprot:COSAG06_NODE_2562_length_6663_cov_2.216941_3_plen_70_part_00
MAVSSAFRIFVLPEAAGPTSAMPTHLLSLSIPPYMLLLLPTCSNDASWSCIAFLINLALPLSVDSSELK